MSALLAPAEPAATVSQLRVDVHQHLWPPSFMDVLRSRTAAPRLVGLTLHLDGEPPFEINPAHHDPAIRSEQEHSDEHLISMSSPLGIETLPPAQAQPLLDAWHTGAAEFAAPFRSWAAVNHPDPDLDALRRHLDAGFVGLQIPATELDTPAALDALLPTLRVIEAAGKPVLVHPGPAPSTATPVPGWWPAVVSYPAQLQAAWWSWHVAGRQSLPDLRICFAAGAGLAPLQHERFSARGGGPFAVDPRTFVEISSYGPRSVDALIRLLGIDTLVFGSDRPYASHAAPAFFGPAVERALHVVNPRRLLEGTAA